MKPNTSIKEARTRLGYSEAALADMVGLTTYEIGDIEARPDEFTTTIPTSNAILLCNRLGLSIFDVLQINPPTLNPQELSTYVRNIRHSSGLTPSQLDELLGFEDGFTNRIELNSVDLTSYPLELLIDIAKHTHTHPSQIVGNAVNQVSQNSL